MRPYLRTQYTWFGLQTFTNDSDAAASGSEYQRQGTCFGPTLLRLVRRDGLAWGGIYTGEQQGWWGSEASTQQPLWIEAVAGPVRVGFEVLSDYTHQYQVEISAIDVWADADHDGLSDAEEAMIGSAATKADTDGDGANDWVDLLPLDPTVGAFGAMPLFCNRSAAHALKFKITAIGGHAHIIVNNSANQAVVPGCMRVPRLVSGAGCVAVVGEGRALPCAAGAVIDPLPILPLGRRAYKIALEAWDGVVADTADVVFNASAFTGSVHQTVDLHAHIASVLSESSKILGFKVTGVGLPSVFSASISATDGHTLVVTAKGRGCGSANVSVQVVLASHGSGGGDSTGELALQIPVRKLGLPGPNQIVNGDFAGNITQTQFGPKLAGWTTNTWSGMFKLEKCPVHVPFGSTSDCVFMQGFGAGKFGLYQRVALQPGTYSLSAMMASVELKPGQWSGTTSIYASFYGERGPVRPDFTGVDVGSTHDLLSGSSGWRQMNATFSLPAAANATIYFFIWGSGWFFVQDVAIHQLQCHPAAPDDLVIGDELAPLAYNVPLTFEDTLMCESGLLLAKGGGGNSL